MDILTEISNPSLKIPYEGTIIASHTSDLQKWTIMDTKCQGPTLFINGQLQSCKNDEYIYHEMFVHPLLCGSIQPKNILIFGGAEGCTLREVLRWPSVESVIQVDWDKDLVSYFQTEEGSTWNGGAYKDPRVQLHFIDAFRWIQSCTQSFDAVFLDLLDPTCSDADYLFYTQLLIYIKSHLSPGGGITINAGQVGPGNSLAAERLALFLKQQFPSSRFHRFATRVFIPSFLGEWCFLTITHKSWSINFHECSLMSNLMSNLSSLRRFTHSELIHNHWPPDYPSALANFSGDNTSPSSIDSSSPKKLETDWIDFEYHRGEYDELYF